MSTSSTTPPSGLPPAYDTLGPYRLVSTLGEGGMGVVYLGLDRAGRAVAIKALRSHIAGDPEARARLAREVTTLERVQHPRVAAVLDADPDGDRPYIVTRYVPGPPLDDYIRDHGPLHGDRLVRFARGLYDALGAIHAAGVVHRDLKPGNVLVVDDEPVVIDFGIAHVADDVRLTSTGLVMGTPGYLSPEVLQGAPVTESTDWWGWAATLAYAATGAPPFGAGRVDVVLGRVRSGDHDLSGVDERLRPLLAAALIPDPLVRPAASTVVEALEQAARGDTPRLGVGTSGRTELLPVQTQVVSPPTEPVAGRTRSMAPRTERLAPWRRGRTAEQATSSSSPPQSPTRQPSSLQPPSQQAASRPVVPPTVVQPTQPPPRRDPQPWDRPPLSGASPAPRQDVGERAGAAYGSSPQTGVDPRLGRPARTLQLTGLVAAVAALATTWPVLAVVVALTWSVLARTVDRSVTATVLRRHEAGGRRGTDVAVAVARSPFQLLAALLSTVVAGLVGVVVAVAVAYAVALAIHLGTGQVAQPTSSVPLGVGALVGCWACWWGSGGVSLRRGSRTLMRGLTRGSLSRELVTGLLVAVALGLLGWAALSHGVPQWWPLGGDPLRDGVVPWQL